MVTKVILEDFKSMLGKGENAVIDSATNLLQKNIPAADSGAAASSYARLNIISQEEIASLMAQVTVTANKKYFQWCHKVADEREALNEQGFRSAGERTEMVYRDSSIVEEMTLVERLKALASYLDGLQWRLKSAMNVLERR